MPALWIWSYLKRHFKQIQIPPPLKILGKLNVENKNKCPPHIHPPPPAAFVDIMVKYILLAIFTELIHKQH